MATKDQAISGCRVISRKSPVTFEYKAVVFHNGQLFVTFLVLVAGVADT